MAITIKDRIALRWLLKNDGKVNMLMPLPESLNNRRIRRLLKNDLIFRMVSHSAIFVHLHLTEKGRAALEEATA